MATKEEPKNKPKISKKKKGVIKNISDAKLEVFSGVGHNPQLECPEKLVETMITFINSF